MAQHQNRRNRMLRFSDFIKNIVVESLHPELRKIVSAPSDKYTVSKKTSLIKKIKELSRKGERTGIEGNMPAGSSRAYLQHDEQYQTKVDGTSTSFKTGTKVAIKSTLDRHHDREQHNGHSLGNMQNDAENGDHYINSNHRVLTEHREYGEDHSQFTTNEDGVLPPLIHHDHENSEHSEVGHCEKVSKPDFKKLTKTESHPNGISHDDFCSALERRHNRNNGRHHHLGDDKERHLDKIDQHPLVENFHNFHGSTGHPPNDYRQIGNLGTFKHPITGKRYIVARDSGYSTDVAKAYGDARKRSRNAHISA